MPITLIGGLAGGAGLRRPLLCAKALKAAAAEFLSTGDRRRARAALIRALETYTSLSAAADAARLQGQASR